MASNLFPHLLALFGKTAGNVAENLKKTRQDNRDLRERYGIERFRSNLKIGEESLSTLLRQNSPQYLAEVEETKAKTAKATTEQEMLQQENEVLKSMSPEDQALMAQGRAGVLKYNMWLSDKKLESPSTETAAAEKAFVQWLDAHPVTNAHHVAAAYKHATKVLHLSRIDKKNFSKVLDAWARESYRDIIVQEATTDTQLMAMAAYLDFDTKDVGLHPKGFKEKKDDNIQLDESSQSMSGRVGGEREERWRPKENPWEEEAAPAPPAAPEPTNIYQGPARAEDFSGNVTYGHVTPRGGPVAVQADPVTGGETEVPPQAPAPEIPPERLEQGVAAYMADRQQRGMPPVSRQQAEAVVRDMWAQMHSGSKMGMAPSVGGPSSLATGADSSVTPAIGAPQAPPAAPPAEPPIGAPAPAGADSTQAKVGAPPLEQIEALAKGGGQMREVTANLRNVINPRTGKLFTVQEAIDQFNEWSEQPAESPVQQALPENPVQRALPRREDFAAELEQQPDTVATQDLPGDDPRRELKYLETLAREGAATENNEADLGVWTDVVKRLQEKINPDTGEYFTAEEAMALADEWMNKNRPPTAEHANGYRVGAPAPRAQGAP